MNTFSELANGKAIGLRGVSYEMLKYGTTNSFIKFMTKFFNCIISDQIIPDVFNLSILKPIIKSNDKTSNDVNNLRPLAMSDAIANCFERIILNQIKQQHTDHNKQFGFKSNSSCSHAIFTLNQAARHAIHIGKRLYACAIDASKAFD